MERCYKLFIHQIHILNVLWHVQNIEKHKLQFRNSVTYILHTCAIWCAEKNLQYHLKFVRFLFGLKYLNLKRVIWKWKKNVYAIVFLGNFIERMERWPFVISDSFWIHFCSFCVFQVPKWPFDRSRRMQRGMLECSWSKLKRKSMNQLRMYNLDKTPNWNERKRNKYHE